MRMTNREAITYARNKIFAYNSDMADFINAAVEALTKAETYRWHIVKESPYELSELDTDLEVVNDDGKHHIAQLHDQGDWGTEWRIKYCLYDTDVWDERENGKIIAWRYIEKFKENNNG